MVHLSNLRFKWRENKEAARRLSEKYDCNLMGKVCLGIYMVHREHQIIYELDSEAEETFEAIYDRYNSQFNLKYLGNFSICTIMCVVCNKTFHGIVLGCLLFLSYFVVKGPDVDQLSQSSQPSQEIGDRSDIAVRTKAGEMIGRLTCVLWVYSNGMLLECFLIMLM